MEKTREELVKEMVARGDLYAMNEIATSGAPMTKLQDAEKEKKDKK